MAFSVAKSYGHGYNDNMLQRNIVKIFDEWKKKPKKKALLVKGARQVGKSTSITEWAEKNYKNVVVINFIEHKRASAAFDGDLDARTIIRELSLLGFGPFVENETLVFFDEIQMCPNARTAIKFLVQDGKFDYIESGSLLGINYKDVKSYPVGFEQQIDMFPMDFEEYLWAKNVGADAIAYIKQCFDDRVPIKDTIHETMMRHFREYLFIGGMPSVVAKALANPDIAETIGEQKDILESYRDDIAKYAEEEKTLAKAMFDAIPTQLAKPVKRFILADIEKGATSNKYKDAIQWLADSGVAHQCFCLSTLELPLDFVAKRNLYKIYLSDTGLLCAETMNGIQNSIMHGDFAINEGSITENAVAAILVATGKPLFYYDKNSRSELDFIVKDGNKINIIEVKSGRDYKKHASLDNARTTFAKQVGTCYVLSKNNIEIENGIIYLPLYMAMFL
jgi:predicted AAA+ superfamily ATPase